MMNYFPYIAGFSCTFALFSYLFKLIRVYRKVEVNCWFCNSNTKVEYSNSNSFICPFCDQYNGFKEDGGYNCIIPAQHAESYNYSSRHHYQNSSLTPKLDEKFNNGFCESCNLNQALKIRAIAEYSSVSSNDSDEVENFQEKLEEIYGLCQQCQATLHQTLGKQSSWLKPLLISWKLMQSKEKALRSSLLKSNTNTSWSIFRKLLVVSCILMCVLRVGCKLDWVEPYESSLKIFSLDFKWIYRALMLLAVMFQCCFIIHQKIKVKYLFSFIGWGGLVSAEWNSASFIPSEIMYYQIAFNILNLIFVLWITGLISSESGVHKKNKKDRPKKGKSNDSTFFTSPAHVPASKDSSFSSKTNISTEESPLKVRTTETDDLDDNLLSLKISTPQKSKNSETFSPQNLFKENSSCRKIDCSVLQPSKFGKHFITQASWVAGGYWGSPGSPQRSRLTSQNVSNLEETRPKPVFSLSRSSSQSSGFVSQYSDCPSSKTHSNLFQQMPKPRYSPRSSLACDPVEKGSVYSFNRSPSSRASPISAGHPHSLDFVDAHSACSASSFLSDNSQLHPRASTLSGSYVHETRPLSLANEVWANESNYNCRVNYISNYFNVGVAFVLGLSVSANIFLLILLFQ